MCVNLISQEQSAMIDIANNFAGTVMGIINALGSDMQLLVVIRINVVLR